MENKSLGEYICRSLSSSEGVFSEGDLTDSQSPFDPIEFGGEDDDTDSVTDFDQEEDGSFVPSESSAEDYKIERESSDVQVNLADVLPTIKNYEEMTDDERAGDLVWDPTVCENSSISEYLKTSDIDRNTNEEHSACSVELAISVLQQCHFNVTEATSEMKKKRSLSKHHCFSILRGFRVRTVFFFI